MEEQNTTARAMPCDIRSFSDIRTGGYIYLDKTQYVYRLTHAKMKYAYLSRPKRFGKSMLLDTLDCYYSGRRSLFEGLWIADKVSEEEWPKHPVIRIDMSECMGLLEQTERQLAKNFEAHEKRLGITDVANNLGNRFGEILTAYAAQGGPLPVVLVDEYDAPLVDQYVHKKNGEDNELEAFARLYRGLFINLKTHENHLHFVMLTGCARFNNMSIFSVLNNLKILSLKSEWATLCGFTKAELEATYGPELDIIAAKRGESREATLAVLCKQYDGYLFGFDPEVERVYNPFSIVNALNDLTKPENKALRMSAYWTGTSGGYALQKWAPELKKLLVRLDKCKIDFRKLETEDITSPNPLPLFFQAGYLTIDHCEGDDVFLRIPNGEISFSIFNHLLPTLMDSETEAFEQAMGEFKAGLRSGDLERGLWGAKRLIAKSRWIVKNYEGAAPEERAALLFSFLCYSAPFRVVCEPKQAYGAPDHVVEAGEYIYVMEFKRPAEGGITKAWRQVRERRYVEPYVGEATEWGHTKTIVALVVAVRDDGRALIDWQAKSYATRDGRLLVGKVRKSAPRWKELEGNV